MVGYLEGSGRGHHQSWVGRYAARASRKGTFEVRIVDGDEKDVVLSLKSMPRPFKKLRGTDLSELAETVRAKL